ncbi:MAG: DnaJ domain-containing protein [Ktedonobacteraceae bacterium]
MDTPDNYYAILGVPIDADSETLKHAYRQLARRFHPDLAGEEGAVQMKRINRAYDVLSDPEKRLNYDTIMGGVIDFRKGGLARPRPRPRKFDPADDIEYSGLSIFSTKGPFHTGPVLRTSLGVISSVGSLSMPEGTIVAIGSLDGKGLLWRTEDTTRQIHFAADPALTVESLRELRFAATGGLLGGWGRLGLHVWDTHDGTLLWSYPLVQRAVSAHYSLDMVLLETSQGQREAMLALPLLPDDTLGPRALGVRGTDVVSHIIGTDPDSLSKPKRCVEEALEKRLFWAIRLRALAQDAHTLLTLSCAHVPGEADEMAIVRRWNLTSRSRFGGKIQPRIALSIIIGPCADYSPPYTFTPNVGTLALAYQGNKIRLYDTARGTYNELSSGTMGGSARIAISPGAQWLAVAREDSEINEGVIDLWSVGKGQIEQKLYHPWQISALHFTEKELVVALTDGTIQVWN